MARRDAWLARLDPAAPQVKSLLVSLLVAVPAVAQTLGYNRTQVPDRAVGDELCVTWNRRDITYHVDSAGSVRTPGEAEFTAIDAAFASWQTLSNSCSDFSFIRGPRTVRLPVGKNSQDTNVVVFRELACRDVVPASDPCLADGTCANAFNCWDHSDYTIALTTVTYSKRTGLIYDADIELNAAPHDDGSSFLFTTISQPPCAEGQDAVTCVSTDVQNTMTHEIGHLLGFDHVSEPGSLMEPTAPPGETSKRVIDSGSAEGFCVTYPKDQAPVPCNELAQSQKRIVATSIGTVGLSGCGCDAAVGSHTALVIAAIGLLATASRRRRA